jgi:drug/metabolite transporter (DMT)-like permease
MAVWHRRLSVGRGTEVGGDEQNGEVTRRGLILFIALGIAWGIPYLFIKVAVSELEPAMVVLARAGLAAVILLPIAFFRREIVPVLKRWRPMLAFTIVEIVLPWYFLSTAETRISSSTAGLLISAVPLAAVGVAFLLGRPAKMSGLNWLGIVVGMLGVAALVGFDVGGSDLIAVAQIAIVVVGYAAGAAILSKWVPELPGIGVTAVALGAAAIAYVPFVAITGGFPTEWPSASVIVAIVVLAVVCSALAFILLIALVGEIGPVRATAITYVNPAVAILAGAIFLHEQVTFWTITGFVLVLSGSYLVTLKRKEPVAPAGPEEAVAEVNGVDADPVSETRPTSREPGSRSG